MKCSTYTFIVDMDDVLCDCSGALLQFVQAEYGLYLELEELTTWEELGYRVAEITGLTVPEAVEDYQRCFAQENFFFHLEPIPGAIEGLMNLVDYGDSIVIATKIPRRAPKAFIDKQDWIDGWFPGNTFHFFGTTGYSKHQLRADYIIDDSAHNILPSKGIHNRLIMDRPWNRHVEGEWRFRDWDGIVAWRAEKAANSRIVGEEEYDTYARVLRNETGAGMADCKGALTRAKGSMDMARQDLLRTGRLTVM